MPRHSQPDDFPGSDASPVPDPAAVPEPPEYLPGQIPADQALVLTTVAVPFGNRLTTYDASGGGIIWHVPAELSARAAAGTLPRREAGDGYTAQCLVVDQNTFELRGVEDGDSWSVEPVDENSLPVPQTEFQARLTQLLTQAALRGESVVFARPGLLEMEPPCVRASAVLDEDGETWLSVLEAFPPITDGPWADAEVDEHRATKTALLDANTLAGGAVLMLLAVQQFTPGPDQIGLFFEESPDGPWPGATSPAG